MLTIIGVILFVFIGIPFILETFLPLGWLWTIIAFFVNPILGIVSGIAWYIAVQDN